jgi:hypothetical protein
MRATPLSTLFLALATTFATAVPAAADTIKLADGSYVSGQATAYDGTTKVLSFRTDAGEDVQYHLDELDGRSVYHVTRNKVPQDNAKGQLQLANYARDIELFVHARRHYEYARKADPSLGPQIDKEIAIGRKMAADYLMRLSKEAIAKNDLKSAEKYLSIMVEKLPDEPATDEARTLLDQYYTTVRAAADDEVEAAASEQLTKELARGKKYYDDMLAKNKKALMNTKNGSLAKNNWNNAIKDGDKALKEIAKVKKKYSDQATVELLESYEVIVQNQMFDIHLAAASFYTTQTDYRSAMGEVNKVLAVDPTNKDALAARARIEQASSRGWGIFN